MTNEIEKKNIFGLSFVILNNKHTHTQHNNESKVLAVLYHERFIFFYTLTVLIYKKVFYLNLKLHNKGFFVVGYPR